MLVTGSWLFLSLEIHEEKMVPVIFSADLLNDAFFQMVIPVMIR